MTEAPPAETPPGQAPAAAKPDETPTPKADEKPAGGTDEFKSEESKNAVLADLAKERGARQTLQQQLVEMQQAQKAQNEALAKAFGLTEEPKSDDDLAATVKALQQQIVDDKHAALLDRLAAKNNIDDEHKDLLTETDPEKLAAQAEKVGALLAASHPEGRPAFQPNPGQGRGGDTDPAAAAEKEYESYYPKPPNRK